MKNTTTTMTKKALVSAIIHACTQVEGNKTVSKDEAVAALIRRECETYNLGADTKISNDQINAVIAAYNDGKITGNKIRKLLATSAPVKAAPVKAAPVKAAPVKAAPVKDLTPTPAAAPVKKPVSIETGIDKLSELFTAITPVNKDNELYKKAESALIKFNAECRKSCTITKSNYDLEVKKLRDAFKAVNAETKKAALKAVKGENLVDVLKNNKNVYQIIKPTSDGILTVTDRLSFSDLLENCTADGKEISPLNVGNFLLSVYTSFVCYNTLQTVGGDKKDNIQTVKGIKQHLCSMFSDKKQPFIRNANPTVASAMGALQKMLSADFKADLGVVAADKKILALAAGLSWDIKNKCIRANSSKKFTEIFYLWLQIRLQGKLIRIVNDGKKDKKHNIPSLVIYG